MSETNERAVASAGSAAGEVVSECKTCGLMDVRRGGELVTLVNWKKNLVAPSPCPECMERSSQAMAAFGARVAAAMNEENWVHEVVHLYRAPQPTLTDAERELIERLAEEREDGHPRAWTNRALTADDRAALRGILERLK